VPLHLIIADVVIIVLLILLLNVFVMFLVCTSDFCNKFLVYILNVSASRLLDELVLLSNRLIELPLVRLKFNNCWIRRKMLQSHAIERLEDAMKARGLIGRNLG
jgi:hypothetical protein